MSDHTSQHQRGNNRVIPGHFKDHENGHDWRVRGARQETAHANQSCRSPRLTSAWL